MLRDILNELTQKDSQATAQPRSDAIVSPKASFMPLLCITIDLHTLFLFQGSAERLPSAAQNP